MAEANGTQACAHCGGAIALRINKTTGEASKARRRYCSDACKGKAREARRPARARLSGSRATRDADCLVCGKGFSSYHSTGAPGGWTRCCSMACSRIARRIRDGSIAKRMKVSASVYRRACDACGARFSTTNPQRRNCKASCSAEWRPAIRECAGCGCDFTQELKWQQRCSLSCKSEAERAAKRRAKAKRRAVERGMEADDIDPISVFNRDGWRCHLCGVKTVQRLRGSCEPLAPELDHVVSLADGGTHTWGNVACACRKCNHQKGAKSAGQIGLPFAA